MRPTRSTYVIKQGGEISPSPFQDLTDTKFCTLPVKRLSRHILGRLRRPSVFHVRLTLSW